MIKTLQKVGIEGTYLNIIKAIYDKTHSQQHPQWWKTDIISTKIRNETRLPTLTSMIQHRFGSFSHINQRRKRNKRIQNGKEEVKHSVFADDKILYVENPKDATRKLLELINEFVKLLDAKLIYRNLLHFYTIPMNY